MARQAYGRVIQVAEKLLEAKPGDPAVTQAPSQARAAIREQGRKVAGEKK